MSIQYTNKYIINFNFYLFLFIFLVVNYMWLTLDYSQGGFQYNYTVNIFDFYFTFGIDGISFFFIYLTALLIPLCLLLAHNSKESFAASELNGLLIFSVGILLLFVFSILDIILFYISFEAILIPFFIYIGVAGYRARRVHAAYLFFFYTLVGSFCMLIAIFFIYLHVGSTDIEYIWNSSFGIERSIVIWLALFITFAVKVPMFPFHIWLPEAHVEAPTEGSVILAGLLLKLGTYGFLRFSFPMFPEISIYFSPLVILMASIGIIYTSFSTLRQIDIKRVIAYSSIAHMNMCMVALFVFNELAFIGSIFLMIAHGVVSGGLFFVIGMIYNRYKTKILFYYSGLIHTMPILSFFFFMLTLGNIAMPGTSNFVGELLIICGITSSYNYLAIVAAAIGAFICTVYSMWLYNKVTFMLPNNNYVKTKDLYIYEYIILLPLLIAMLLLGIFAYKFILVYESNIYFNFFELLL